MRNADNFKDIQWSIGAMGEPIPGLSIHGKDIRNYQHGNSFLAGVSLSVSGVRVSTTPHFDRNSKHAYNSYGLRLGLPTRDYITKNYIRDRAYLKLKFN